MKNLGIALIVIGLVMALVTGFSFVTKEKVLDVGPVEINKEEKHPVKWSPIVGVGILVAGVLIFATNRKK